MSDRVTATASILRNVYRSPIEDAVSERFIGAVDATLRLTNLELETYMTNEGAFIARLSGVLSETVDEMSRSVLDYIPTWNWPRWEDR